MREAENNSVQLNGTSVPRSQRRAAPVTTERAVSTEKAPSVSTKISNVRNASPRRGRSARNAQRSKVKEEISFKANQLSNINATVDNDGGIEHAGENESVTVMSNAARNARLGNNEREDVANASALQNINEAELADEQAMIEKRIEQHMPPFYAVANEFFDGHEASDYDSEEEVEEIDECADGIESNDNKTEKVKELRKEKEESERVRTIIEEQQVDSSSEGEVYESQTATESSETSYRPGKNMKGTGFKKVGKKGKKGSGSKTEKSTRLEKEGARTGISRKIKQEETKNEPVKETGNRGRRIRILLETKQMPARYESISEGSEEDHEYIYEKDETGVLIAEIEGDAAVDDDDGSSDSSYRPSESRQRKLRGGSKRNRARATRGRRHGRGTGTLRTGNHLESDAFRIEITATKHTKSEECPVETKLSTTKAKSNIVKTAPKLEGSELAVCASQKKSLSFSAAKKKNVDIKGDLRQRDRGNPNYSEEFLEESGDEDYTPRGTNKNADNEKVIENFDETSGEESSSEDEYDDTSTSGSENIEEDRSLKGDILEESDESSESEYTDDEKGSEVEYEVEYEDEHERDGDDEQVDGDKI